MKPLGKWLPSAAVLAAILLATACTQFLKPFNDADFFWHLKTGEWIVEHRALPSEDPFSFTTRGATDVTRRFTLTSYWLSQVLLHLLHAAGGFGALALLRWLIILSIAASVWARTRGDRSLRAALTLLLVLALSAFPLERPQAFSFLFFALLMQLLFDVRGSGETSPPPAWEMISVPAVMVLWANSHGGHLLGQAVILILLVVEGARFLHPSLRPPPGGRYRLLLAAGLGGLLFSLLNPNTWHAVEEVLSFSLSAAGNLEYRPTWFIFRRFHAPAVAVYWALLFLAVAGTLADRRKADPAEMVVLAGLGWFSLVQNRYIPFFVIAAVPVIGRSLSSARMSRRAGVMLLSAALLAAGGVCWPERGNLRDIRGQGWVNGYLFPVRAADFIVSRNLAGNLYNPIRWGGYLIYRLAPGRKVFSDGRILDADAYRDATAVAAGDPSAVGGLPRWRRVLDERGVDYLATPFFTLLGEVHPLVDGLVADPAWEPVFVGLNSVIFVRNVPANRGVIERDGMPRAALASSMIEITDRLMAASPGNVISYLVKAGLLLRLGREEEAVPLLEQARRIDPLNPLAGDLLRSLRGGASSSGGGSGPGEGIPP